MVRKWKWSLLTHLWYRVRQMDLTVIFVIFQKREARSHQVNIVEALKLSSYPRLENVRNAPLAMILCCRRSEVDAHGGGVGHG